VEFTLSKVSVVTVRVARRGRLVAVHVQRLGRGVHAVGFGRPAAAGPYAVQVRAVDLAGNAASATGVLHVRPAHRPPPR
jgi:hypothetical protein